MYMKVAKFMNILNTKLFFHALFTRIDSITSKKASCFTYLRKHLKNKNGLEIGGPSQIFKEKNLIPIYEYFNALDQCNFSQINQWQNIQSDILNNEIICDASELSIISDNSYDFVLASHCLEHIANPIKALNEWVRVIRAQGHLVIVVPDKEYTFDHRRPITSFSHLMKDFNDHIDESDLTHLSQILELHDLDRDPLAGSFQDFETRSHNNFQNRCLHQHVFDISLLKQLFSYFNLKLVSIENQRPHHIIAVLQKIIR